MLLAAIRHCMSDPRFQQLVADNRLGLLCFGYPPDDLVTMGIPTVSLGHLHSDKDMRVAYSAADVFILPSLDDNLPNTMLEAMSCGTPSHRVECRRYSRRDKRRRHWLLSASR